MPGQALEGLGYDVLGTAVPRLEVYAQSFGMPIPGPGRQVWRRVANDLTSDTFRTPSCADCQRPSHSEAAKFQADQAGTSN